MSFPFIVSLVVAMVAVVGISLYAHRGTKSKAMTAEAVAKASVVAEEKSPDHL